jgi:hypothetical protein
MNKLLDFVSDVNLRTNIGSTDLIEPERSTLDRAGTRRSFLEAGVLQLGYHDFLTHA